MHLKKVFRLEIYSKYFLFVCKNLKNKLKKVIFLTYFEKEKYQALEKNYLCDRKESWLI